MLINSCYKDYQNTYYFNYFIASCSVLIFNEITYLMKFCILIRKTYFSRKIKNDKKKDDNKQPIISNTNNYNLNESSKYLNNKRVRFQPINSVNDERETLLNSKYTNSNNTNLYDTINEINEANNIYE